LKKIPNVLSALNLAESAVAISVVLSPDLGSNLLRGELLGKSLLSTGHLDDVLHLVLGNDAVAILIVSFENLIELSL
jgi:hypothetical protein